MMTSKITRLGTLLVVAAVAANCGTSSSNKGQPVAAGSKVTTQNKLTDDKSTPSTRSLTDVLTTTQSKVGYGVGGAMIAAGSALYLTQAVEGMVNGLSKAERWAYGDRYFITLEYWRGQINKARNDITVALRGPVTDADLRASEGVVESMSKIESQIEGLVGREYGIQKAFLSEKEEILAQANKELNAAREVSRTAFDTYKAELAKYETMSKDLSAELETLRNQKPEGKYAVQAHEKKIAEKVAEKETKLSDQSKLLAKLHEDEKAAEKAVRPFEKAAQAADEACQPYRKKIASIVTKAKESNVNVETHLAKLEEASIRIGKDVASKEAKLAELTSKLAQEAHPLFAKTFTTLRSTFADPAKVAKIRTTFISGGIVVIAGTVAIQLMADSFSDNTGETRINAEVLTNQNGTNKPIEAKTLTVSTNASSTNTVPRKQDPR
jgi:hypothetical protein